MQPIMVSVPLWILAVILIGVATVSGVVFWAVGRFLSRKGGETPAQEKAQKDAGNPTRKPQDRVSVPQPTLQKEEGIAMMSQQEAQKLRDQIAAATTRTNKAAEVIEARNKTIKDLGEQIAEKDRVIGQKDARITELEGQLTRLRTQGEETSKAVSQD
ncbi:MAG: hypothetical protein HY459_00710, partial [Parcubacteria group bacterium]|nr:hypothetical protein [Parcubacteria group bacterium]